MEKTGTSGFNRMSVPEEPRMQMSQAAIDAVKSGMHENNRKASQRVIGNLIMGGLAMSDFYVEEPSFTELREEHLLEVLGIYNYYVLNTTVSFHTEPLSLDEMRLSVLNNDARFKSYVIEHGGEMQGYVLIARHKNKQAYDSSGEISVYLKPDCTGRRIGQSALFFIEKRAAELDFHVLVATVCAENERSRRLFLKNGYEQSAYFKEIGSKFGRRLDIASYQKIIGGFSHETRGGLSQSK